MTGPNLVEMIGFEPIAFLKYRIYSPGPLHHRSRISINTLFRMCVLKHSTWMNPLALRPENALIR